MTTNSEPLGCTHKVAPGAECEICSSRGRATQLAKEPNPTLRRRATVTIFVPDGYADADEFLKDCQFERVETDPQFATDAKEI